MDLTNIKVIKGLCREYGIWPSKKLGQSFLINKKVLTKIVQTAELKKDDVVLEIGPGFGVLTQELIKYAGRVVAVEKDKRMAEFLTVNNQQLTVNNNLKVVNNDILKLSVKEVFNIFTGSFSRQRFACRLQDDNRFKIVANLPYQITSLVLWKFLHEEPQKFDNHPSVPSFKRRGEQRPELMVLMVQKEVAKRICARSGEMSVLAVMCQFYADSKIMAKVNRENFWPRPEVDSAIIKIKPRNYADRSFDSLSTRFARSRSLRTGADLRGREFNEKKFFQFVKIGFAHKRKMLKNNLAKGLKMPADEVIKMLRLIGLSEKARAEELEVVDWVGLFKVF